MISPARALEPILKETYGIMVYQEQIMRIAQDLAGYSLGEADLLRRAMGKKKKSEMEKHQSLFVNGATERGVEPGSPRPCSSRWCCSPNTASTRATPPPMAP